MTGSSPAPLVLFLVGTGGLLFGAVAPAGVGGEPVISDTAVQFYLLMSIAAVALEWESEDRRTQAEGDERDEPL